MAKEKRDAKAPQAATIAAKIAEHREAFSVATEERSRLEASRPAMLADEEATEAQLEDLDHRIAKMGRRIDRANAMIAKLAPLWEAADEQERADAETAGRKTLYDRARAAVPEYERLARKEYAPAAAKMAAVLGAMADLSSIVHQANQALPDGCEALDIEAFRQPPYDPGVRPPDTTREETYWLDGDGRECNSPIMYGVAGAMKPTTRDVTMRTRTVKVKNDWSPNRRHTIPYLGYSAILPCVRHDEPDFWWNGVVSSSKDSGFMR